jgi:hypothetical protein
MEYMILAWRVNHNGLKVVISQDTNKEMGEKLYRHAEREAKVYDFELKPESIYENTILCPQK